MTACDSYPRDFLLWYVSAFSKMATKRKSACVSSSSSSKEDSKKKRTQGFLDSYSESFPCIVRGKNQFRAKCTVCDSDFGIGAGGVDDVKTHVKGPRHVKNEKKLEAEKKDRLTSKSITSFLVQKPATSSAADHDLNVVRAEVMLVDMCVETSQSLSSLDKLAKGLGKMLPDSKIAKSITCGRSKATAMVKELATQTANSLIQRMKAQPFTLSTDGSNDKGTMKLFPLVVRTYDSATQEVRSDPLSVPFIEGSATGEKIFELIQKEMTDNEIPWENCLALGCDNANVMVGQDKGVYGFMKREHPALFLCGCVCHLIHIAASKGADTLPVDVGQLLLDVFYYLDKSANRQYNLKVCQLQENIKATKILKHVKTRWLSIGNCLPRLLDSWDALYSFFREEEKNAPKGKQQQKKVQDLKDTFGSRTKQLYCMFLEDAIKIFESVNTELQTHNPMIGKLQGRLEKLVKELMLRFVQPQEMMGKNVMDIDIKKVKKKEGQDIIIAEKARILISEGKLKDNKVGQFYKDVVSFYSTSVAYLQKRLPLSEPLLKHMQVVDPNKQLTSNFTDLEFLVKRFPALLQAHSPPTTISQLQLEFAQYQVTDISHILEKCDRDDKVWAAIQDMKVEGESVFKCLPSTILNLMTLPHSSAHCERIFSHVRKTKTDFRASMKPETLEALIVVQARPGDYLNRDYTAEKLRNLRSAYYRSLKQYE